jgi:hydrogenase expression/formation protein HypC
MCLAVPAEIVEIEGNTATLDFGGARRKANISLLEDAKIGDYVIVHVGYAIQKLSKEEALESQKIWEEILRQA